MKYKLISVLFLVILFNLQIVLSQRQGDSCQYDSQTSGVCKPIYECAKAIRDLKLGKPPTICSQTPVQVVCCASASSSTSNQPKPSLTPSQISRLRLTDQKCHEYSRLVYINVTRPGVTLGSQDTTTVADKCGFQAVPLIVGGTLAKPREFPHMARLGYGDRNSLRWSCGGVVISRRYILTAAHCVITRDGAPTYARVGDLVFAQDNDDARPQTIEISQLISHPEYKSNLNYHDIALVQLARNIDFNTYVRPACLNTEYSFPQRRAIATGWGATEWYGDDSNSLLKVTLDLFSFNDCGRTFKNDRKTPNGLQDNQQLCAGSKTEQKDSCQGDSGGPLQVYHDNYCMYNVLGVTSFGKGCGTIGIPGIYTRVSNYINWIESNAFTYG